jgi:hypothetical protein
MDFLGRKRPLAAGPTGAPIRGSALSPDPNLGPSEDLIQYMETFNC